MVEKVTGMRAEGEEEVDRATKDPSGFPQFEVQDQRWKAYLQDTDEARLVRGCILGLPDWKEPTQRQVDRFPLFALRKPPDVLAQKENKDKEADDGGETDVSDHWMSFLKRKGALGDCKPDDFVPPQNFLKFYTVAGLRAHIPQVVASWKGNQVMPHFIVLVPRNTTSIAKDHFINCFHTLAALKRYSLYKGRSHKQFAYCPYCGMRQENQDSAYSHARKHLHYEFLCESCLQYHTPTIGLIMNHVVECHLVTCMPSALGTPSGKGGSGSGQGGGSTSGASASARSTPVSKSV